MNFDKDKLWAMVCATAICIVAIWKGIQGADTLIAMVVTGIFAIVNGKSTEDQDKKTEQIEGKISSTTKEGGE